jgi:ribosomal-protein-alanine N-acetyltransferase
MTAIETARLIVRRFVADDWPDLHEMVLQYQASAVAQYDHPWPTTAGEIKGVAEWFASGEDYLAVCLKTTSKVIGLVCLNPDRENDRTFGLGYVFNSDYHGQGYATEACRAMLDRAFGELEAERVATGTAAANGPSCRLLRRLGLQETGRHRASFRKTQDRQPIEFEAISFAISKDEWASYLRKRLAAERRRVRAR